jgi:hypothetical protein
LGVTDSRGECSLKSGEIGQEDIRISRVDHERFGAAVEQGDRPLTSANGVPCSARSGCG